MSTFDTGYESAPSREPRRRAHAGAGVPPHSLDAEKSILGAICLRNESLDEARELGVVPTDFYLDAHQKIYDVACGLNDRHQPIDLVTLTDALRARGWYEMVGGATTLTALFEHSFTAGNAAHYAKIVKEKSTLRNLINACTDVIGGAVDGVDDVDQFLDEAETKIFKAADAHNANTMAELKDVLVSTMSHIEELALSKKQVTGVSTGFTDFDMITTGLHPGQVMIIAARPGMGKTSWMLSAIQHPAIVDKAVVAVFSLEMSKEELAFRFLSSLSRIDSRKLKTGRLQDRDWQSLTQAADQLAKAKVLIDDSGGLTVTQMRSRCRRLKAIHKKLDMIVIDYLQLMKGPRGKGSEMNRERELSEISRGLKELAKELKCPIIAASQLNRQVENRQDKRPNLSDLRESGAIEQDADLVCFIHRDDYYDREAESQGIAEFIVAKNRAGDTNTIRLAWIPQYTLFANLAREMPGTPINPPRPDKGDISL